ncbi:MAG: isoprenyl transferase [Bacteroidales bacterium]|nr:isoprenyl transferase [Bacteroidales bacterium]
MDFKKEIDINDLPKHIAVIMDGNGRWAKKHGKMRIFGHQNGVKSVRETSEAAAEIGIKYLTLYAFSTENWNRPKKEVDALMTLLVHTIESEIKTLNKNNIRLEAIGDLENLPKKSYSKLIEAIESTKNNDRMTLILALSYSSRWEIVNAVKKIAEKISKNEISSDMIDQKLFSSFLTTSKYPDPELLIRTSGEFRVSNFLLWQIAYAELYFTQKLWPDFRKDDLYEAILNYQKRERRFGMISEQINIQK